VIEQQQEQFFSEEELKAFGKKEEKYRQFFSASGIMNEISSMTEVVGYSVPFLL